MSLEPSSPNPDVILVDVRGRIQSFATAFRSSLTGAVAVRVPVFLCAGAPGYFGFNLQVFVSK